MTATFTYEPFSPAFDEDPHPTYRYLREHAPVFFWEPANVYLVSRYADVERMLRDAAFGMPGLAPLTRDTPLTEGGELQRRIMANGFFGRTAEDHTRLRRLVAPAFTPRAAQRRHDVVESIVTSLMDGFAPSRADVVREFAHHIPMRVMARLLAIPPEHDALFLRFSRAWVATVVPWVTPDEFDAQVAVFPEAVGMIRSLIEERRAAPGDDLLSDLVRACDEHDRLSDDELLGVVASLIAAGADTTIHLISYGVRTLLAHPSVLAAVRADFSLLPRALAEASRLDSFSKHSLSRTVLSETTLHGVTMPAGSRVLLLMASALRDPLEFPSPDDFVLDREPTRLMFGAGVHFCVGHFLARVEATAAVELLLRRFPLLRADGPAVFEPHVMRRHLASLPVLLS